MRETLKHLSIGLLAGIAMGGILGCVEFYILVKPFGMHLADPSEMLMILCIYSAHWGLAMAVVGILRGFLNRSDSCQKGALYFYYLLFTLMGGGFSYVFCLINKKRLTSAGASSTIITNIVLLVVFAALVWIIGKISTRTSPKIGKISFFSTFVVWIALIVIGVGWLKAAEKEDGTSDTALDPSRPNVLMVLVDTLRASHLGCYGYERDTSPNIDAFSNEGICFSRCIATSSWTRPATVSVLTGIFPATHNQNHLFSVLPSRTLMLPDGAGDLGWRTAFIAANSLVSKPYGFAQNVDYYRGVGTTIDSSLSRVLHWGNNIINKIVKTKGKVYILSLFRFIRTAWGDSSIEKRDADSINAEFLSFLDMNPSAPFFAYLHYMDPHTPYDPEPPYDGMFADPRYSGPIMTHPPQSPMEKEIPPISFQKELEQDQENHLRNQYDGEIAEFDAQFANLIKALKKRGIYDKTLIVFTSDHGEAFYDHGVWGHGNTLFQEEIHVPLIFKLPGGEHGGKVYSGICRQVDIAPTILEFMGAEPWPQVQGQSLAEVMKAEKEDWPGFWAISDVTIVDYYLSSYTEAGRKVVHIEGPKELWLFYDLMKDVNEQTPISEENRAELEAMKEALRNRLDFLKQDKWRSSTRSVSSEDLERLKSLGYGY